jgi:hypothetical protein
VWQFKEASMKKPIVLSLFLFCSVSYGATYYVPDTVDPARYVTIQGAIYYASSGDTIIVDNGTYSENLDFYGRNLTLKSVNGADACVIQDDSGMHFPRPVVTFENGETNDAVLDGFTITGGKGSRECWFAP